MRPTSSLLTARERRRRRAPLPPAHLLGAQRLTVVPHNGVLESFGPVVEHLVNVQWPAPPGALSTTPLEVTREAGTEVTRICEPHIVVPTLTEQYIDTRQTHTRYRLHVHARPRTPAAPFEVRRWNRRTVCICTHCTHYWTPSRKIPTVGEVERKWKEGGNKRAAVAVTSS